MIKCKYCTCQFPDCDRTCGLVPIEPGPQDQKYLPLIQMFQKDIHSLLFELLELESVIEKIRLTVFNQSRKNNSDTLSINASSLNKKCAYSPYFLKKNHYDLWIERGMPTECEHHNDCRTCPYVEEA